jgi:photosystem II stability/assembly factor-like uncharacterized protein
MARATSVLWASGAAFILGCGAAGEPPDDPAALDLRSSDAGSGGHAPSGGGGSRADAAGTGGHAGAAAGRSGAGGSGPTGGGGATGGALDAGSGGAIVVGDASGPLTGTPGVWENVTPVGIDLVSLFGVLDVLADPVHPGTFYGFVCTQGVYKSTDFGATWAHVSADGSIEGSAPWGEAIAPDGSYMLASTGFKVNAGAWKSTDGGVTWQSHTIGGNDDPYMFDIDASDKNHAISSTHSIPNIFESTDGGLTWTDRGSAGTGLSNYVFFVTGSTWLSVAQAGSAAGTRRTTDRGATWSDVAPAQHAHGNALIFVEPDQRHVFVGGHDHGVFRSTDGGATFTLVSATRSSVLFATADTLYSMDPGAAAGGTLPVPQSTARSDGTHWAAFSVPAAMTNGAKRPAVARDPATGKWVIVSGNWNAGFWRYIEP